MSSSGDFFKGLIFGAVVGAAAGILLAPKSGEETREDIKKFAMETGDKAEKYYKRARRQVERKIEDLKEAGSNIDLDAYKKLIGKIVDEIKEDGEVTSDIAKKIGEKLSDDWKDLKSAVA